MNGFANEITFKDRTTFLGRNGEFYCDGIVFTRFGREIMIQPVTSKGCIGRGYLSIPDNKETLDATIDLLIKMRDTSVR